MDTIQYTPVVFESTAELIATIEEYVTTHNAHPKPFVWTTSAAAI